MSDSLVVDSSVVIKWFLVEVFSDKAALILAEYEESKFRLFAPELVEAEIGSILRTGVGLCSLIVALNVRVDSADKTAKLACFP